jgi:PAS domain S-box-containing protein
MASQFQHFLGAVRHPLIAVDRQGFVTDCNAVAAEIMGATGDAIPGTPLWESVHPDDVTDVRSAVAHVFDTRDARHLKFRVQDRSGRWRTLDAVMQVIGADANAASVSALEVTQSSSDAADETSRQAEALKTLGLVAGSVSHDFANLLMVIAGESAHMLDALGKESPLTRHVDTIRTAADRATAMVQHLLSVSRQHTDSAIVLDLRDVVDGMQEIIQRLVGERIVVDVLTPAALWPVSAHRVQIERILLNLSVNARDAMPSGGRLTIETSNVSAPALRAHGIEAEDGAVAISVADTGVGMDPETLSRAFEPFFTTKQGRGTGLGLATVSAAVADAGGWTRVTSAPGTGTRITILLPRVATAVETEPRVQPRVVGGTETILLVEDEPSVLTIVFDMLESAGYEVLAARSQSAAMATVDSHTGPVHLLLTDVVLPESSGLELAEWLQRRYPALPVLFMSGYAEPAFADGRSGSLGSHFIAKPFDRQRLLRAVRRAVESASLAQDYVHREPAPG